MQISNVIDIILIGISLAMDAGALTIANCTTYKNKLTPIKEWSMPVAFALFQILMPIIGFYLGYIVRDYIQGVVGYISFAIFFALALKIVIDNVIEIKKSKQGLSENQTQSESQKKNSELTLPILLIQGVATSIDALIVGFTFVGNYATPFTPSMIIGIVTFAIVTIALLFGKYLGLVFKKYASWVGATILFILAVKSLIQAILG